MLQRSSKSSALRLVPIRRFVCNLVTSSISPPSLSALENQSFQNLTKPARNVDRHSVDCRARRNSHVRERCHRHGIFPRRNTHCKESTGVFELDLSKNHFSGRPPG